MGTKLDSRLVQIIQVRRNRAGWSHQNHVDFMKANFGKDSCTKLTAPEAELYLDRLESLGQGGNRPAKGASRKSGGHQKGTVSQEQFAWCATGQKSKVITGLQEWLKE